MYKVKRNMEDTYEDTWGVPIKADINFDVFTPETKSGLQVDQTTVSVSGGRVTVKNPDGHKKTLHLSKKGVTDLFNFAREAGEPSLGYYKRAARDGARVGDDAAIAKAKEAVDAIVKGYDGKALRFRGVPKDAETTFAGKVVGVVSDKFCHVPVELVKLEIDAALDGFYTGVTQTRNIYGRPVFRYNLGSVPDAASLSGEAEYSLEVDTGQNSGLSGYNVAIFGNILICSNGVRVTKMEKSIHAKHTRVREMDEAEAAPLVAKRIAMTVMGALDSVAFVDKLLKKAQRRKVAPERLLAILKGFVVGGYISKRVAKQVFDRLDEQKGIDGNTLWTLSQTLTYVGTHNEGLGQGVRDSLATLGGKVLDAPDFLKAAEADGKTVELAECIQRKPYKRKATAVAAE